MHPYECATVFFALSVQSRVMSDKKPTSITIRLGEELLDIIRKSAEKNRHSMNSEIVERIRHSELPSDECRAFLQEEAAELEAQIPGIKWELDQAHKHLGEMITTLTETENPVTDDKIALLQTQTRFYRAKLEDAESRLRRIKRVINL